MWVYIGHHLYEVRNGQNHLICSATVIDVQYDASTQTVVPHKMKVEWPDQKMAMTLALGEITGANPVPAESAGKVREMAQAWIEWGRSQGYVQ